MTGRNGGVIATNATCGVGEFASVRSRLRSRSRSHRALVVSVRTSNDAHDAAGIGK